MHKRYGIIKDFRDRDINGISCGFIYGNDGYDYYVNNNST